MRRPDEDEAAASMELTCREESRVRRPDEDEDAQASMELTCRVEESRVFRVQGASA